MDEIFYWLLDLLADFLARINPARAKKVQAIKAEADRLDGLAKEAEIQRQANEAAYKTSLNYRNELNKTLHESELIERELEAEFAESNLRIAKLKEDVAEAKKQIDSLSDHDAVRADL